MKNFNVSKETKNGAVEFTLSGYFSEEVQLPQIEKADLIKIDLEKVSGLNSFGIKSWCQWVKAVPATSKIELLNCPIIFVKAFNTVAGFLTSNMEVVSFMVPFYSPSTNTRRDVLYKKDQEFIMGQPVKHPSILDPEKKPMEIDATPNYFKFIERKP